MKSNPAHRLLCTDVLIAIFKRGYEDRPDQVAEAFLLAYMAVLARMQEKIESDLKGIMAKFIEHPPSTKKPDAT